MRAVIFHASAGGGHKSAAEALKLACADSSAFSEVVLKDILEFAPPLFRKTYAEGYLDVVKHAPELWGYMFSKSDDINKRKWKQQIRSTFNRINTPTLMRFWRDFQPDIAISTHFMPLEIIFSKIRRGRLATRNFCVVTDLAVHALWMVKNVDCYYTATEEAARQLQRGGQPQTGTCVSGIPIAPSFSESFDAATTRKDLGLNPDRFTILLMGGGHGVGPTADLISSFGPSDLDCQLIVVAGSNKKLYKKCVAAANAIDNGCAILGFVDNVSQLIDASNLVISKPGGLTTSEVMAKGKPLVIVNPIPGQEQQNSDYLLEHGAAARLLDPSDAAWKIEQLASDEKRIQSMNRHARRIGMPRAAQTVRDDIIRRMKG